MVNIDKIYEKKKIEKNITNLKSNIKNYNIQLENIKEIKIHQPIIKQEINDIFNLIEEMCYLLEKNSLKDTIHYTNIKNFEADIRLIKNKAELQEFNTNAYEKRMKTEKFGCENALKVATKALNNLYD